MIAPVKSLKKDEIIRLADGMCRHGHTYLNHYQCYLSETTDEGYRRGHLDIESSNLDADYGVILSWCIKEDDTETTLSDVLTKEDLETYEPGKEDTRVVTNLVEAMKTFNELVTWYGARFDIPFIRTRATICGVKFPAYGTIKHKDLWFTCRGKFKLSSNRLENACRVILGKTTKTRIDSKYWRGGQRGDEKSLQYILKHNQHDVDDLKRLYKHIVEFSRPISTSI